MPDVNFTITKEIGTISTKNGWEKKLNMISWNNRPAKFDIRDWSTDDGKMSKGITLSNEEMKTLYDILTEYYKNEELNRRTI